MSFSRRFYSCSMYLTILVFSLLTVSGMALTSQGQETVDNATLSQQLRELQLQVSKLEAALKQNHQAKTTTKQGTGMMGGPKKKMKAGMGSMQTGQMDRGMGMGLMKKMRMQGKMSNPGTSSMGMMGGSGMSMMGQMKGMGQMQMPSALPGFAGASHIYHIGSTNFFLDHPQHITLTQEQQTKLNQIKQQSLAEQATLDRWIAEAEQELWLLTSSDVPDAAKIEAKVREAEKLRGDKRIAFIRAVGKAAQVLTDEQRRVLVGMLPSEDQAADSNSQ